MNKIIGVTELQRRFKRVFDDIVKRRIPYVLTRGSRPEAALIPYEDFLRFQELRENQVFDRFDRLMERTTGQNAAFSDEEVEADIRAASEERQRR